MNPIYLVMVGGLIFALFPVLFRVVRGPGLPTRVVALDLMATMAVGLIATYAVAVRQAQSRDAGSPKRLIAEERTDERGSAGAQSGARGAGAAVVDHGRHAREEPVVRRLVDHMDVVVPLETKTVPPAGQDGSHT